jgi:ATP-dependent DNA ligase
MIVRRDGETVRIYPRRGYDWTSRLPSIVAGAASIRREVSPWTARPW